MHVPGAVPSGSLTLKVPVQIAKDGRGDVGMEGGGVGGGAGVGDGRRSAEAGFWNGDEEEGTFWEGDGLPGYVAPVRRRR